MLFNFRIFRNLWILGCETVIKTRKIINVIITKNEYLIYKSRFSIDLNWKEQLHFAYKYCFKINLMQGKKIGKLTYTYIKVGDLFLNLKYLNKVNCNACALKPNSMTSLLKK